MSLRDKANADSGRWEPTEDGDYIEGVVTALDTFDGGQYEPAPMVTIDCTTVIVGGAEQGPSSIRVLCGRSVLKREWESQAPQVGDTVGIAYKGLKQSKKPGGDDYHDYGVAVERSSLKAAAAAGSSDGDW